MRAPIFVSLMLVAMPWLTALVQAQEESEKPKGVFGLLGKLTNPAGNAFIYKDVAGKEWKTKNFKHISAEEGKKFQEALDAKNGFRHYTFGMTAEEFLKVAKAHKENFQRGSALGLDGPDGTWVQAVGRQYLNRAGAVIQYGFYKKKLAWIHIQAESQNEHDGANAVAAYQGIADTYGPGMIIHAAHPKKFDSGYGGVFWFSDKVEIQFYGAYDPSAAMKPKGRLDAGVTEERAGTFYIEIRSKEFLKDYFVTARKNAKAGM